jgi:hypothetical protein
VDVVVCRWTSSTGAAMSYIDGNSAPMRCVSACHATPLLQPGVILIGQEVDTLPVAYVQRQCLSCGGSMRMTCRAVPVVPASLPTMRGSQCSSLQAPACCSLTARSSGTSPFTSFDATQYYAGGMSQVWRHSARVSALPRRWSDSPSSAVLCSQVTVWNLYEPSATLLSCLRGTCEPHLCSGGGGTLFAAFIVLGNVTTTLYSNTAGTADPAFAIVNVSATYLRPPLYRACPAGYYSPANTLVCMPCPAGMWH